MGRGDRADRRRGAEGRLPELGGEIRSLSEIGRARAGRDRAPPLPRDVSDVGMTAAEATNRLGLSVRRRGAERNFRYWTIAPAILVLLFIGLFPLVYSLVVSFQG